MLAVPDPRPIALPFPALEPPEPDLDALSRQTAAQVARVEAATEVGQVLAVERAWEASRRSVSTWQAWTHIRYAQDTSDPDNVARKARSDAASPVLDSLDSRVKAAILDSPLRPGVERALGGYLLALWQADRDAHDDALHDDLLREQQLVSRYQACVGGAQIPFRGERLGFPALRARGQDPDRATRHEASHALWGWYARQRDEIVEIYAELVRLRDRMARRLGDQQHTPMAYRRMRRLGYGPDQVAAFREEIRLHVLPLVQELRAAQARRLGLDRLMAWDLGLHDPGGNPRPRGGPEWQIQRAAELMRRLDPQLGAFFGMMRDRQLLDLEPRPGKTPGGFCHYLPDVEAPFVFANMNGTDDDARVFTHELGHAFQVWSSRGNPHLDLAWPTYDAAEVHSMSLELLAWPHVDLFFEEQAPRFRRDHLTSALILLPWLAAIDEFQHLVYADPGADRDELWRDCEARWQPEQDWGDLALPARGARWMGISHAFHTPFYGIDYALAQTCALQLWTLARRDHGAAMERYLALCRMGGQAPFVELVEGAGLRSPFEPGVLAEAVAQARGVLAEGAA